MARFLKNKKASTGKAPGEAVFIGDKKVNSVTYEIFNYNKDFSDESNPDEIDESLKFQDEDSITWLNITGLHNPDKLKKIAQKFNIHPLVMEDIANTGQRPKIEEYEDSVFIVIKMINYNEENGKVFNEQVSLILKENLLITFQEREGDVFEPVRERIRNKRGRIRSLKSDYLCYALLDSLLDNYLIIIEKIGGKIETLELEILESPDDETLTKINTFKREISYLRKTIRPVKELVQRLSIMDSELIIESTIPFLKDLFDLSTQALEVVETYREILSDQHAIYNTWINNRLNEIIKFLTLFSAVFIPLSFLSGVYGTNFEYFPELKYKYSYFIFWGVLIVTALFIIRFFKNKKWL
ncbi:MAG: magnesium/cobalt transporter CorA [Desulforegulaceae bacterium]|nr:magnesium/cobalt transporter CorA [Desulforegulaceae bacterium]